MTDDKKEPKATKPSDKRKIFIGLICLILIAAGIFYIWHKNTQKAQQADDVSSAVAVADVNRLLPEHKDYDKLLKLQTEKMIVLQKLNSYMIEEKSPQVPEVNPAPDVFAQVTEQQDNLREIKSRQQLKEESAVKENEIREALSAEKNKVIQRINDKYYNAILNATIKLDNADNLRLTPSERDELLAQLDYLKKQRGEAVFQIERQFDAQVAKELMAWRAQREKELNIRNAEVRQADAADSNAKQEAEKARDSEYLQDRLKMMQAKKNDSQRLLILLHTKDNEISLLKKNILKDIASKAAKIAVQKHLKLVVANTPVRYGLFGDPNIDIFSSKFLSGMVIGTDAEDITDDILNELQADKAAPQSK